MDLSSIILNFIASILAGFVVNYFSNKFKSFNKLNYNMEPKQIPKKNIKTIYLDETDEHIRIQNRKWLNLLITDFTFYTITFFILSASIYLPLSFRSLEGIDLNNTKLHLNFFLSKDDYILVSTLTAFFIYVPILFISQKVSYLIASIINNFKKVTHNQLIGIRIIIIFLLAIFITANIWWIINSNVYWWDAIKNTFLIVFFIISVGMLSQ